MVVHKLSLLEKILNYSLNDINEILSQLKTSPRKYYYSYEKIKVKNGKVKKRPIDPSRDKLRDIHNRINKALFSSIPLPEHIQGSVKGKTNITNASKHRAKLYHFQTDLTGFFQFVTNRHVFLALRRQGFSNDVAHLLTKLTTYKGHLPQGVPTSSFLANIVGLTFDSAILDLCKQHNITYTRYVDDLWFSSNLDFSELIPKILEIIVSKGFLYSHRKTISKKGSIEGTGCFVLTNGSMTITRQLLKKLNNPDISSLSKKGIENYKHRVESA